VEGDWSRISPKLISQAAEAGDELCLEVWEEVGQYLGLGIGTIINVFAPDVFALGGQIAKAGRPLLEAAVRSARNVAIPYLFKDCQITLAEQIDDAGMLGGAALALEELKWKN
jgi:glucokinase